MRRPDIERLLPSVYRLALDPPEEWGLAPDEALAAVLDTMEELHHPIDEVLDQLEAYLDPRRAPAPFVSYLCGWLDLDWLFDGTTSGATGGRRSSAAIGDPLSSGSGRLRELAAAAAELARWRGTERGLRRFLEIATGASGFAISDAADSGAALPFHIVIEAPSGTEPLRPLIERVIVEEKPAYVTYELRFAPAGE